LDHSFQAVELLRNKHFQGLWPCWQHEGSLDKDMVLIRDIQEPIIKEFLTEYDTEILAASLQHTTFCWLRSSMFHHDVQMGDIFARYNETVQNRQIQ
jgi:hypothetical protein